jgi:hypothetical protein
MNDSQTGNLNFIKFQNELGEKWKVNHGYWDSPSNPIFNDRSIIKRKMKLLEMKRKCGKKLSNILSREKRFCNWDLVYIFLARIQVIQFDKDCVMIE